MNQKEADKKWMRAAFDASRNSTCIRMSVGAVIVSSFSNLARFGYNGAPDGCVTCASKGCNRIANNIPSGTQVETCRGLHAEQHALLNTLKFIGSADGASLYCTHHPCSICAKLLITAGIKTVVFQVDYPDDLAKELFAEAKVIVRQYEGE